MTSAPTIIQQLVHWLRHHYDEVIHQYLIFTSSSSNDSGEHAIVYTKNFFFINNAFLLSKLMSICDKQQKCMNTAELSVVSICFGYRV